MSSKQRIKDLFIGAVVIVFSVFIMLHPEDGYALMMVGLGFSAFGFGIRKLFYYFSMARHMVGGKSMLYYGIIALDFGAFTLALSDLPHIYIALYLAGVYVFSGAIDIMGAFEAKRLDAPAWKGRMASGLLNLAVAVTSCVCLRSTRMLVYIYAAGLIYSSLLRIASALRKTAIVYIP